MLDKAKHFLEEIKMYAQYTNTFVKILFDEAFVNSWKYNNKHKQTHNSSTVGTLIALSDLLDIMVILARKTQEND